MSSAEAECKCGGSMLVTGTEDFCEVTYNMFMREHAGCYRISKPVVIAALSTRYEEAILCKEPDAPEITSWMKMYSKLTDCGLEPHKFLRPFEEVCDQVKAREEEDER